MPKKKTQKKSENNNLDIQKLMQNTDSYKSLIYGIVTVVVLFIVIALGIRTLSQNQAEIDDQAAVSEDADDVLTKEYIVSEGETLWSIAEKSYNNGYAWEEIAKANNLSEPYALEKGQKLTIPRISPTEESEDMTQEESVPTVAPTTAPTAVPSPTSVPTQQQDAASQGEKITGTSYTIVEGDNLWTIAVRAYGDGYRWVELAKANDIQNPDLIYPGNSLKLSRP